MPGAVGKRAEPQLGAASSVAPSTVDPNKSLPTPGPMGPKAFSQVSFSTIVSSKNSRVLELEDDVEEVTSNM